MSIVKPQVFRARASDFWVDSRGRQYIEGWIVVIGSEIEHVDTWNDALDRVEWYLKKVHAFYDKHGIAWQ